MRTALLQRWTLGSAKRMTCVAGERPGWLSSAMLSERLAGFKVAQLEAAQRVAQMVRLAAQAKQLAREAAWELVKAQMALERDTATAQVDMATVEQHRVTAMERLAQAMMIATELEMTMAKRCEVANLSRY